MIRKREYPLTIFLSIDIIIPHQEITLAPDGSIFISFDLEHQIYKFSKDGKIILKFGRKGQGPGDLYFPGGLSILDKKFLVIKEYASLRQFSLFDFEGKFVKKVRTKYPVFGLISLKEDKIAYLSTYKEEGNRYKTRVSIKNISSDQEKVVDTFSIIDKSSIYLSNNMMIKFENLIGEALIARSGEGNLLVGVSNNPYIKMYSPGGELLHTISLKIIPIAVTRRYIENYKNYSLRNEKGEMAKKLNAMSFASFFGDYLPYYRFP